MIVSTVFDFIWFPHTNSSVHVTRFLPPSEEPRTVLMYNNLMYHMLGHVTETIGGDQWERLVSSRLFEPIGMVDSVMVYQADRDMIELATPYELYRGELREINLDAQIALNAYLGVSGKMFSEVLNNSNSFHKEAKTKELSRSEESLW